MVIRHQWKILNSVLGNTLSDVAGVALLELRHKTYRSCFHDRLVKGLHLFSSNCLPSLKEVISLHGSLFSSQSDR